MDQLNSNDFYRLDNELHRIIFSGCSKPHIWQLVQDANMNYVRTRVLNVTSTKSTMAELYKQHQKLVQAIINHNAAEGVATITQHVNRVVGDIDALKKKYPDYFN